MYRTSYGGTTAGRTTATSAYRPSLSSSAYATPRVSAKSGGSFDAGGYRSSARPSSYAPTATSYGGGALSTAYTRPTAASTYASRPSAVTTTAALTGTGAYDTYSRARRDSSVSRSESIDSLGAGRDYDNLTTKERYERTLDTYASSVLKQSQDRVSARASAYAGVAATAATATAARSSRESSLTRTTSTGYMPLANGVSATSAGARHSYAAAGRAYSGASSGSSYRPSYRGTTPGGTVYRSRSGSRQSSVSRSASGIYANGSSSNLYGRSATDAHFTARDSGAAENGLASGSDLSLGNEGERSATATPDGHYAAGTLTRYEKQRPESNRRNDKMSGSKGVSASAVSAALAPLADADASSSGGDGSPNWEEINDDDTQIIDDTLSEEEPGSRAADTPTSDTSASKLSPIKEGAAGGRDEAAANNDMPRNPAARDASGGRPRQQHTDLLSRCTQQGAAKVATTAATAAGAAGTNGSSTGESKGGKKSKKRVERKSSTKSNSSSSSGSSGKTGSPKKRRTPPKTTRTSVNAPKSAVIEVENNYEPAVGLVQRVADIDATVICVQDQQEGFADGTVPVMQRVRQRTKPVPVAPAAARAIMNINLERPAERRHAVRSMPDRVLVRKRTKPVRAAGDERAAVSAEFAQPPPAGRAVCVLPEPVRVRKKTKPVRAAGDESAAVDCVWRKESAAWTTSRSLSEMPQWCIRAVPLPAATDRSVATSAHYDAPGASAAAATSVRAAAMHCAAATASVRAAEQHCETVTAQLAQEEAHMGAYEKIVHRPRQCVRTQPVRPAGDCAAVTHAELHMDGAAAFKAAVVVEKPRIRLRSKPVRTTTEEHRHSEYCWSLSPQQHSASATVADRVHSALYSTISAPWSAGRHTVARFDRPPALSRASVCLPAVNRGAAQCAAVRAAERASLHADIVVAVEEEADRCDILFHAAARHCAAATVSVPLLETAACDVMLSCRAKEMSIQRALALSACESASALHRATAAAAPVHRTASSSSASGKSGASAALLQRNASSSGSSHSSGPVPPPRVSRSQSSTDNEEALVRRLQRDSPLKASVERTVAVEGRLRAMHSATGSGDSGMQPPLAAEPDDPPSLVYFRNKLRLMRNAKSMEKSSDEDSKSSSSPAVTTAVSREVLSLLSVANEHNVTLAAPMTGSLHSSFAATPERKSSSGSGNAHLLNGNGVQPARLEPPVVDLDFEPLTSDEVAQLTAISEKRKRPNKHRRLPTISSVDSQMSAYESADSDEEELTAVLADAAPAAIADCMGRSADSPTSFMTAASDFHGSLDDVRRGVAEQQHVRNGAADGQRQSSTATTTFGRAFRTSFDSLIKWPSSAGKFTGGTTGRMARSSAQPAQCDADAVGAVGAAKKSASSASLPGFLAGQQHVISKIHVKSGNAANGGNSADMPPTPPKAAISGGPSPQPHVGGIAGRPAAGITRTQSNIEKCVKQIDKVLSRVRSFQPRNSERRQDDNRLLDEKLACLDRVYDSIVMDSDEVKQSTDRLVAARGPNADTVQVHVTAATFERARSSEVARPQPMRTSQLHMPHYEVAGGRQQQHTSNLLTVEADGKQATVNSLAPITTAAAPTARASSEDQARLDFTRSWLQGDMRPFYQAPKAAATAPPPPADEFDRARQAAADGDDDESIGSASAEVAAINSRHDERLSQAGKPVVAKPPSAASSNHGVMSPRRHQAVIQPSPIQYAHMQKQEVGQTIEHRLQQAGFPSFSPTGSEQPQSKPMPLPVQQVNYANRYLPRRQMEALWQSPGGGNNRLGVPSSRISVASDDGGGGGGRFAARRARHLQPPQHQQQPGGHGAASPAYSAKADSWIYDARSDDHDYDNAMHYGRRRRPAAAEHHHQHRPAFEWRRPAEAPPPAMVHSDPHDLVADLELNVDTERAGDNRRRFPTAAPANGADDCDDGYDGLVRYRRPQPQTVAHEVPRIRSYVEADFARIAHHRTPERARRQSQQPQMPAPPQQQPAAQQQQRRASDTGTHYAVVGVLPPPAPHDNGDVMNASGAPDLDAIEKDAKSPFDVINDEPIGWSRVSHMRHRFDAPQTQPPPAVVAGHEGAYDMRTYDNNAAHNQLTVHTTGLTALSPASTSPASSWGAKPVNVVQPIQRCDDYETMPHQRKAANAAGADGNHGNHAPELPDTPPPPRPPHWQHDMLYDNVTKPSAAVAGSRKSRFKNMFSKLKGGDPATSASSGALWRAGSQTSQTSAASFMKLTPHNGHAPAALTTSANSSGNPFGADAGKKKAGFGSRLKQSLFGTKK